MAAQELEYTHPTDNVSGDVTPTLTVGSQAVGYGPERLYDNDPSYPFKVDSTTFRLVWDFGSAQTVKFVALIHHNFAPALAGVKFEMNATNAWGGPSFSQTLTVPAYHNDSFPVNIHSDLRPTNPSYRYASLAVTSANTVNCAIGEVIIAEELRTLSTHMLYVASMEEEEDHPLVEHKTDVGVSTIYAHGTRWRWLRGVVRPSQTVDTQLRAWNRASQGRALPFIILPKQAESEAWYVRFEKPQMKRTYIGPAYTSVYPLAFEEVSRGLKPTPSAV